MHVRFERLDIDGSIVDGSNVDHVMNDRSDLYHCDLEDPALYGSKNNRLMYIESIDTSGPVSKGCSNRSL